MRIASRFQRSGRSNDRLDRALTAGVWVGLISSGCFFGLPELEDPDGGIGGGGTFGAVGGEGGDSPAAGDGGGGIGGTDVLPGCDEFGLKFCEGTCVPIGPENGCSNPETCAPCPSLPKAAAPTCGGDGNLCQITGCDADFADCDGDLLTYNQGQGVATGPAAGCEYSFGTIAASTQQIAAPRAQIRLDDNSRDDWNGIPAYRLEHTCVDCEDNNTPFDPTAQNEAPPSTDLSAYFRVAWNADSFFVLAEAFDDSVFNRGSTLGGSCGSNAEGNYVPGPSCEDAFDIYFDGLQRGENIGSNGVHRIFIGTSEASFLPSQGQPPPGTINLRAVQPNGPRCYRLEAQFPWTLLFSNQSQPVPGKFPPAGGQTYGFDIAVSDFDPLLSDPNSFELQSQLFWSQRAPQSELQPSIAGIGSIILTDHSAGQTPQ